MCTLAAGVAVAGMALQYSQSQVAKSDATAQAAQQTFATQQQQQQVAQNQGAINDQFGVGTDPAAQANASRLNQQISGVTGATMDQGNTDLNNNLLASITQNRTQLGDAGMLGTGTDQANQGQYLTDYLTGKQRLAANAQNQAQSIQGSLDQQRNTLLGQYGQPTQANPWATNYLSQQSLALGQAGSQQPAQTALGGLFNTAAGLTTANSQAVGSGQQGAAGLFSPSSSSAAAGAGGAGAGTSTAVPMFFGS